MGLFANEYNSQLQSSEYLRTPSILLPIHACVLFFTYITYIFVSYFKFFLRILLALIFQCVILSFHCVIN